MSFINLATNLSLAMVLRVGGSMVTRGEVTVGTLTSFALQVMGYFVSVNVYVYGM